MKSNNLSENKILDEVDEALLAEVPEHGIKHETENNKTNEQGAKLARLLRVVGSLVVVAAAACFLVQRWGGLDHLMRYFSFLIFTAGLGGLGIFCGIRLREDKSARTFLALGGGLVVVNFAQLAALIYSRFLIGNDFIKYPSFLLWQAPSMGSLLFASAIGVPLLIAISAASFTALAREVRMPLLLAFTGLNLALLVPLRDPTSTGLLSIVMVIVLGVLHKCIRNNPVMKTFEGRIVQIHMLLPVAIIIGRGAYLYETTTLLFGLLSLNLSLVLFGILPHLFEDKSTKLMLQRSSILSSSLGWFFVCNAIMDSLRTSGEFVIPVIVLPVICTFLAMSFAGIGNGKFERSLASVTGVIAVVFQVILFPGIYTFSFALLISLLVMSYGFISRERLLFFGGMSGIAISLINHLRLAIHFEVVSPWLSLAVLGTATIIAAAFAEKRFAQILARVGDVKSQLASWK